MSTHHPSVPSSDRLDLVSVELVCKQYVVLERVFKASGGGGHGKPGVHTAQPTETSLGFTEVCGLGVGQ